MEKDNSLSSLLDKNLLKKKNRHKSYRIQIKDIFNSFAININQHQSVTSIPTTMILVKFQGKIYHNYLLCK